MSPLLCALFFLSGVSALLFETLWFRQAGLAFGNSVWASSLVLSSFMAGLAIGNALAARYVERIRSPLRVYAALEIAIAVAGLGLVLRLASLSPWLAPLLRPLLDVMWLENLVRLSAGFLLLLVPATAMGATLPLMVAALRAKDPSFGGALGLLYGWNTLGAVVGALVGESWLLEHLGVLGTGVAAASCNLAAAAGALTIAPRFVRAEEPASASGRRLRSVASASFLLAAAFGAGAILLALEVVWFRFLHLFVHAGSLAFAWMLAIVLLGIGLGGLIGGAWLRRRPNARNHAPLVAIAAGVATIALYAGFQRSSSLFSGFDSASPLVIAWVSTSLMFPVAALSGVLFPLLGASLARLLPSEPAATGWLTLANTIGSALGSLLAGFVLLPVLGMESSLFGLAAAYGFVAVLASIPAEWPDSRVGLAALAAFVAALVLFPSGQMERYMRSPVITWHAGHEHEVLALREGRTETAMIVERRHAGERLNTFLITDNVAMSSTATFARRYMKLYVYWPVALRPDPKSALLISYGVGSTAKALVDTRSLETIDVVDISREILELAGVVYPDAAENPLNDPRVRIHIEDGRFFLNLTRKRYDLVTAEPPPPKNAGVVNLYTREYFSLIRDRLNDGGVTTYWLPVHSLLESDTKAILRAFCDVFDDCALWVGQGLDWMMTGSRGLRQAPSEEDFAAQWRDPVVAPELRALGFERPEQLGATFLGDAEWLRERTAGTAPLLDSWPKRLADRPQRAALRAFHGWLDEAAAAERFRHSAYIHEIFPAGLRERTLSYFDVQRLINEIGRGQPVGWPRLLPEIHRLLAPPKLPELALWRLGITSDLVDAAQSALRSERPMGAHVRTLAIRALVDGDFAGAARMLESARQVARTDAGTLLLEIYALGRAGDREAAAALLAHYERGLVKFGESVAWLERTFELDKLEGAGDTQPAVQR